MSPNAEPRPRGDGLAAAEIVAGPHNSIDRNPNKVALQFRSATPRHSVERALTTNPQVESGSSNDLPSAGASSAAHRAIATACETWKQVPVCVEGDEMDLGWEPNEDKIGETIANLELLFERTIVTSLET